MWKHTPKKCSHELYDGRCSSNWCSYLKQTVFMFFKSIGVILFQKCYLLLVIFYLYMESLQLDISLVILLLFFSSFDILVLTAAYTSPTGSRSICFLYSCLWVRACCCAMMVGHVWWCAAADRLTLAMPCTWPFSFRRAAHAEGQFDPWWW